MSQPELGTWRGAAGEANVHPRTPMRPNHTFRAGSIMKPFVATVVLQLAEEGKLALDDPLTAVLPHDVVAGSERRPDHGAHASRPHERRPGVRRRAIRPHGSRRDPTAVSRSTSSIARPDSRGGSGQARRTRTRTPTTTCSASSSKATGQPWRTAIRERVIDRIGLTHTSLPQPGRLASIESDAAHGYELVNGKLRDVTDIDSSRCWRRAQPVATRS